MKPTLTPKELATAIGVSESSLKRWVDTGLLRAGRTAGGHRRIPVAEAIRFIRHTSATLVRPEVLGLPDLAQSRDPSRAHDPDAALYEHLVEGRAAEARGLILAEYLEGRSVAAICDGPVRTAMHRIGELWQHDRRGIFVEHRAIDICVQALVQLRILLPAAAGPTAVGGAPPGDPYLLPSLMVSTALLDAGLQAINLGPDTPLDILAAAAYDLDACVVWVSISSTPDEAALKTGLRALAERLASRGIPLVVGGRQRELARELSGARIVESLSELSTIAASLTVPARGAP